MKVSAVLLVVGILAVGIFGFLGMDPAMDHADRICVASLVNIVACPMEALSNAIYHMRAYASFSLAIFTSSFVLLALIVLALRGFASAALFVPAPERARCALQRPRNSSSAHRRKFIRWLSRFENSPSRL